jgi:hypothetical protein
MLSIRLCKQYRHRKLLRDNLRRMTDRHNIPANKVEEIIFDNKDVLFDHQDAKTPE